MAHLPQKEILLWRMIRTIRRLHEHIENNHPGYIGKNIRKAVRYGMGVYGQFKQLRGTLTQTHRGEAGIRKHLNS